MTDSFALFPGWDRCAVCGRSTGGWVHTCSDCVLADRNPQPATGTEPLTSSSALTNGVAK